MTVPELSQIPAVILAGGLGTRVREVLGEIPKPLALIGSCPFIEYLLEKLRCAGVRRVIISTGYRAEMIESHLGSRWRGLEVSYSREQTPLGTGGAVALAAQGIAEDLFFALNGDSFFDCDLDSLVEFHRQCDSDLTLALSEVGEVSRYGKVVIDAQGRIVSFGEKAAQGRGLINGGIYLLKRSLFDEVPGGSISLERDLIPAWLVRRCYGYTGSAKRVFLDIGTPETLASAAITLERFRPS